jgi:tripeptide aminopeptidase
MIREISTKLLDIQKEFNMEENKILELKELLSIPTYTWEEDRLIEYLESIFVDKGYTYDIDSLGNLYVTKGVSEYYPLVVAHTDTVHSVTEMVVNEEMKPNAQGELKLALKAYRTDNGNPTGIGGDDKAGVFICLQLLERLDVVKAFFPVAEETGCHGSKGANADFFGDVGYAIQFDSTENNSMSLTLMGVQLFDQESDFFMKTKNVIVEHGITEWKHHPYTDTMVLKDRFGFACLNFAAGYYHLHSVNEYVVIDDVENSTDLGESVIKKLGNELYEYSSPEPEWSWPY